MARKRKTSPAEDVITIIAAFPWWLGLALAFIAYVALHSMALTSPATTAATPEQMGQVMVGTMKQSLAAIGQYLVPFLCLIGAALSFSRRQARKQLIDKVVAGPGSSRLQDMSWQEFEQLVGEAFRLKGYTVHEIGGGGADGGVDLVLRKNSEKFLVQCKQWRALKVGVTVIRELYGVMAAGSATGGFVVTCGRFTDEARAFANGRNVMLIDGGELEQMIRQTQRNSSENPVPASTIVDQGDAVPACPACGKSMLLRTAQRGANIGRKFWGCSGYPTCRGTVSLK